jgi:cytochrome o ubiquinol oxidase subunit IV
MQRAMPDHGPGVGRYLVGLVLALVLTAIPFGLVAAAVLERTTTLLVIAAAALLQVMVHLRYFLHLDFTRTPRENVVAIAFAAILVFLMVGGSYWIMLDLGYRMAQ